MSADVPPMGPGAPGFWNADPSEPGVMFIPELDGLERRVCIMVKRSGEAPLAAIRIGFADVRQLLEFCAGWLARGDEDGGHMGALWLSLGTWVADAKTAGELMVKVPNDPDAHTYAEVPLSKVIALFALQDIALVPAPVMRRIVANREELAAAVRGKDPKA